MTIYKTRKTESLSNQKTKKNFDAFKQRAKVESSPSAQLLDALDRASQAFSITPEQVKVIEDELKSGKLKSIDNRQSGFLYIDRLYSDDSRQSDTKAFQYTLKALERFWGDTDKVVSDILRFYGMKNDDTKYWYKQTAQLTAEDIIKRTQETINKIPSYLTIRAAIEDMDKAFGASTKNKESGKEDWSHLTKDIERLAARIYELSKNDRYASQFDEVENTSVKNDIETLKQGAINAIGDSTDKAPDYIGFADKKFVDRINKAISDAEDKADAEDKGFDVGTLTAKQIIKLLGGAVKEKPAIVTADGTTTNTGEKVVVDSKTNKTTDGRPVIYV